MRPFVVAAIALVGLTGCFPDPPPTEPPVTTTTTTTTTTTVAPQAALQVSISTPSTPVYRLVFTATVTVSTLSAVPASGVSVDVTLPNGLTFADPPATSTHTFAVGAIAGNDSASFAVDLVPGDVALGARVIQATATADNATGASGQLGVTPVGISLIATITPDPTNPPFIDIATPGTVSWTASANDAAAAIFWTCEAVSGLPCPPVDALLTPQATITFDTTSLAVDTYTLTAWASSADPNYVGPVATTVTFTTTNVGN